MCLYCLCSYKIWEVETEFLGTRRPTSILGERTKKHFVQSKMGRADQLLELPLDTWWALHSHTHCTCALRHVSAHTLTHMHIHVHTQRSYSKYFGWNYFRGKAGLLSHVFQCPLPRTVSPAALQMRFLLLIRLRIEIQHIFSFGWVLFLWCLPDYPALKTDFVSHAQWSKFNPRTREAEAEELLRVQSLPDNSETLPKKPGEVGALFSCHVSYSWPTIWLRLEWTKTQPKWLGTL